MSDTPPPFTPTQLCALTKLDLPQLAEAVKRGFIPKDYPQAESIRGAFAFYAEKLSHESKRWPTSFNSQAQAAGTTGLSAALLAEWKRRGCPAFRNGKIYIYEAVVWALTKLDGNEVLDLTAERARLAKSQADKLELENAVTRRETWPAEEVREYISSRASIIREAVIPLPDQLAARCNPADPEHARAQLAEWVDEFFKRCAVKEPKHDPSQTAA